MNITNNWKYEEWANEMKKSPYDTSYDIQRYINYEIYAEDIAKALDVNVGFQAMGHGNHAFQIGRRAGIRSMRSEHDGNSAVSSAVKFSEEGSAFSQGSFRIRRYTGHAAGQTGANTAFGDSASRIRHKKVHVCKGGCAGAQNFRNRQLRPPVDVIRF